MTQLSGQALQHPHIREEVRKLCSGFPAEYSRKLDAERAYPTEFVGAHLDEPRPVLPRRARARDAEKLLMGALTISADVDAAGKRGHDLSW